MQGARKSIGFPFLVEKPIVLIRDEVIDELELTINVQSEPIRNETRPSPDSTRKPTASRSRVRAFASPGFKSMVMLLMFSR
jgi:hypothetical protein